MLIKLDCEKYLNTIKEKAKKYIKENGINPKLVIFNPSDDDANQIYVRNKKKHLEDVGIEVIVIDDAPSKQYERDLVRKYQDRVFKLCLVQKTIDFNVHLDYIENSLILIDIECIRSSNEYNLVPTPNGIVNMLKRQENIDFTGKNCVIINRSEIIGKPLMKRLLDENATVTVCHSKTNYDDLVDLCHNADFIFTGAGERNFIDSEYLNRWSEKDFQVIVDFSINRDSRGYLCGDFNLGNVISEYDTDDWATIYYTPTPKGTGLTTIAQLIENIVEFYGDKPLWEVE